jgi:hypothetical protein
MTLKALVVSAFAVMTFGTAGPAFAAEKLPDLTLLKLTGFKIDTTAIPGHTLLRYTTVMVNANSGGGPFEVRGSRATTSQTDMTVKQRVYNTSGGFTDYSIPGAAISWGGDGHNHWHLEDIEIGWATTPSGATRPSAKHGFCFHDGQAWKLSLAGAPQSALYTWCGNVQSMLSTRMGLSVGWGDRYGWWTNFQWVDLGKTGSVPNGTYRLWDKVDPRYHEVTYSNNTTWADVRISGTTVWGVAYGPHA